MPAKRVSLSDWSGAWAVSYADVATWTSDRRVGSGGEIEVGKFFLPSPFKEPCVVANLDLLALGSG